MFKENKYFNLVFVGDGIVFKSLKNLVSKYNLEANVWFYGKTYDENKIGELVYNASLCVSPGNIGLTAMHCLNYGCPAITHDNFSMQMPEFEAVQEGITGTFFKENNSVSLKESIQQWLIRVPKKNDELSENCFAVIDRYYNPKVQIGLLKKILI